MAINTNSKRFSIGLIIFVVSVSFSSREFVPGWGFNLGLSETLLYAIAIVGGIAGGALIGGRYFLAGMAGGALASLGAMLAESAFLATVSKTDTGTLAMIDIAGSLPGILVGVGLAFLQSRLIAKRPTT